MNDQSHADHSTDWVKWIKWLLALKLLSALFVTSGEFSHPHIIRQLDTMGVALRYWMRWTLEPNTPHPLLPAVLTAGDTSGITPMEFPFMNLFYAPFFALPIEAARTAAWFTHVAISFGLTYWHYRLWRGKTVLDIDAGKAAMLLPLVGISTVFIGRFMPDYLAFLFVSCAIALSWEKPRPFASYALALIGLLMKPPAILAFAIYFTATRKHRRSLLWIAPAVAVAFAYYKFGNGFIKAISDYHAYFLTDLRNPVQSLIDFFSHPRELAKLIYKNLFAPPIVFFVLTALSLKFGKSKLPLTLFAILALQVIGGAALDGDHAFIHFYYFIGASFTVALLSVSVIERVPKWAVILFGLAVLIFQIEMVTYEMRPALKGFTGESAYAQCRALKKATPQFPWGKAYAFRSTLSEYPDLGLCFGEIQNSKNSEFGFFKKSAPIPSDCKVVQESADYALATCGA